MKTVVNLGFKEIFLFLITLFVLERDAAMKRIRSFHKEGGGAAAGAGGSAPGAGKAGVKNPNVARFARLLSAYAAFGILKEIPLLSVLPVASYPFLWLLQILGYGSCSLDNLMNKPFSQYYLLHLIYFILCGHQCEINYMIYIYYIYIMF